jgi:glycosyltransferase involved in cell wall biosynthesis
LLEGAAMGRALITTDAVGCRDVVQDGRNGFVVPVGDTQALAAAIKKLAARPELIAEFGANSRKLVMERFDERLVNKSILSEYQQLLARS